MQKIYDLIDHKKNSGLNLYNYNIFKNLLVILPLGKVRAKESVRLPFDRPLNHPGGGSPEQDRHSKKWKWVQGRHKIRNRIRRKWPDICAFRERNYSEESCNLRVDTHGVPLCKILYILVGTLEKSDDLLSFFPLLLLDTMGSCNIIRTYPYIHGNSIALAYFWSQSLHPLSQETNNDVPRRQPQSSANFLGKWASSDLPWEWPNSSLCWPQCLSCIIPNWNGNFHSEGGSCLRALFFRKNLGSRKWSSSEHNCLGRKFLLGHTMGIKGHRKLGSIRRPDVLPSMIEFLSRLGVIIWRQLSACMIYRVP